MYCDMSKGTCWTEATSNSDNRHPIALAIIELLLSEVISQSIEAFQVLLRAILGLVIPIQYCQDAMKEL